MKVWVAALCITVLPVLLFFLWCLCSEEKTVIQRAIRMICRVVVAGVVLVVLVFCIYSVFFNPQEAETTRDKLDSIREDIGVQGIMEYILDYWSENEVIEYLLGK